MTAIPSTSNCCLPARPIICKMVLSSYSYKTSNNLLILCIHKIDFRYDKYDYSVCSVNIVLCGFDYDKVCRQIHSHRWKLKKNVCKYMRLSRWLVNFQNKPNVDVVMSTGSFPSLNICSIMFLSLCKNPAWWQPMPFIANFCNWYIILCENILFWYWIIFLDWKPVAFYRLILLPFRWILLFDRWWNEIVVPSIKFQPLAWRFYGCYKRSMDYHNSFND